MNVKVTNQFAESGGKLVTGGGDAVTPTAGKIFNALQALAACTFESDTESNIDGLNDATIPAGLTIFGRFDSVHLDTGSAIAYHNV